MPCVWRSPPPKTRKMGSDSRELDLQEAVSCSRWMLGTSTDALEEEEIFLTAEPSVQFPLGEYIFSLVML